MLAVCKLAGCRNKRKEGGKKGGVVGAGVGVEWICAGEYCSVEKGESRARRKEERKGKERRITRFRKFISSSRFGPLHSLILSPTPLRMLTAHAQLICCFPVPGSMHI